MIFYPILSALFDPNSTRTSDQEHNLSQHLDEGLLESHRVERMWRMNQPTPQAEPSVKKPSKSNNPTRRKRWPLVIVGGFIALIVIGGGGFLGASFLEEHDSFCASCHTVPESTYVTRATGTSSDPNAAVADLATMHYHLAQDKHQSFACISCHRGDASMNQRVQTLALGARDVGIFITGKADPVLEKLQIDQPALTNAACINCHTETMLTVKGLQSHFHNWLPQTNQLIAIGKQLITPSGSGRGRGLRTVNTSVTCTNCHMAHKTVTVDPQLMFVDKTIAQQACDTCHRDARERPESFNRLFRQ